MDGGYCLVLESKKDLEGAVELRAVGEDSNYPVRIAAAREMPGGTPLATNGARINNVRLVAGQPQRIEVQVEDSALPLCLSLGR